MAAAVPRHGAGRVPGDPDDDRAPRSCRPRRRTSWPTRATGCSGSPTTAAPATAGPNFSWVLATRALKRMKGLDLSSLTLALSGAEPVDPDAVEAFVAAAAPFGFRARRRVPGVRHGRGRHRRLVPAAWPGPRVRHRRPRRPRARSRRQAGRGRRSRRPRARRPPPPAARHAGARPGDARRRPRDARGAARAPRRRAADPRHVGDARLLQASRRHRRAVRRRLAVHRRPRLHDRRRARAVRPDQGRHHRRRPQRVPGGHRARRRRPSTACGPATSSPSAWRATRARRASSSSPRCEGRRPPTPRPSATPSTTARSRCAGCRRAT